MAPKRHYKEYLLNESSQPSKATKCRRLANEKEIPLSKNGERTYSLEEYPEDTPTTNKQNIPDEGLVAEGASGQSSLEYLRGKYLVSPIREHLLQDRPNRDSSEMQPVGEGVSRKTHSVLELPPSPDSHCTSQFCGDRQDMQIGPEAQDMLEKQPGCNVPATPPDQQETPNQQVETFLLDGDDPAYPGAPLTKGQSLILLMSYVLRHNVTGVALGHLLKIFNEHFPGMVPALEHISAATRTVVADKVTYSMDKTLFPLRKVLVNPIKDQPDSRTSHKIPGYLSTQMHIHDSMLAGDVTGCRGQVKQRNSVRSPGSDCDMSPPGPDCDMSPPGSDCDVSPPVPDSDMSPPGSDCDVSPPGPNSDMSPPRLTVTCFHLDLTVTCLHRTDCDVSPPGPDCDVSPPGPDCDVSPEFTRT
ncbi:hypothetical protein WMY93_029979 [Mugilogobius chulae]|uniref:Uncharacterized protein n=1 Tax=Mugilogobius chulae TaxID=88201 RepID=A0AAW0MQ22_9GOBI